MSEPNPLVAERVDTTTPLAGAFLLEDGEMLVRAIENQSWLEGGMAAFSFVMDTVAMVSDPLGSLIATGLGWLMDHLSPLKDWLHQLTGDADQVRAFAQTWSNAAGQLTTAASELQRKVQADLSEFAGINAEGWRAASTEITQHLQGDLFTLRSRI